MPRKQWREENMKQALEEVSAGMAVRRAAQLFNVPRNTLGDRVQGRVSHGCRSGPRQLLAQEDEEALVQYCLYCAQHGFPLTKPRLLAYANAVRRKRNPSEHLPPLGKKWWLLFRRRHAAELSMRTPDNINRGRAACAKQHTMDKFFNLLSSTMEQFGLTNQPSQIYNCDETGFQMHDTRVKVLSARGSKHVYQQSPGTRDNVSVLACFNAAGEDIPPFIIYAKRFPGGQYTQGGPPDALYGKSPAGSIDGDLFHRWFQHFVLHARKERPLLLIFDGHKSHLNPDVAEAAKREDVVLMCLPPHCSHILQPLDVGFFGPLKAGFAKVAGNLCHFKHSYIVNKTEFAKVFCHPYQRLKDRGIVKEGFRKCGIFPLNPNAVDSSRLMPSTGPRSNTTSSQDPAAPSSPSPVQTSASQQPPAAPSSALDHPLVAAGLIQPDLAEILTRVEYKKKTTGRISTEARVITGAEYEKLLLQKKNLAKVAKKAKEQRAKKRRAQTTEGPATASRTTPSCNCSCNCKSSASTTVPSADASSSSSSSSQQPE